MFYLVCFNHCNLAKQTLTSLNKRVKKGIIGNSFLYSQNLSSQNAINIIEGIGYRNVAFLIAIVNTRL